MLDQKLIFESYLYIYGKDELVTGSKSTDEKIYRIIHLSPRRRTESTR